jgi:hypothetical protein
LLCTDREQQRTERICIRFSLLAVANKDQTKKTVLGFGALAGLSPSRSLLQHGLLGLWNVDIPAAARRGKAARTLTKQKNKETTYKPNQKPPGIQRNITKPKGSTNLQTI